MVDCARDPEVVGVVSVPQRTRFERLNDPYDLQRRLRGNLAELKALNDKLDPHRSDPGNGKRQRWQDRRTQLCSECVPSTVDYLREHHGLKVDPELLAQLRQFGAQV